MERHVTFIVIAEILDHIFRPAICLGQQHAVGVMDIDMLAQFLQKCVGFRLVFAIGAFGFIEVGNRVHTQSVDAQPEPVVDNPQDFLPHGRFFVVEVWLMAIKPMPVISLGNRIPAPVGCFKILENDSGFAVFFVIVVPDIIIAPFGTRFGAAGPLEPTVLVRGVVEDKLGDDFQAFGVGCFQKTLEVGNRAVIGVDVTIVGNIITVIAQRGGIKRQQPDGGDAKIDDIIEFFCQAGKIADAILV